MKSPEEKARLKALAKAFRMPKFQSMRGRKSSVTNAAVNSIIPSFRPTANEIEEALETLGMDVIDVRCAYCGDLMSEWDHLRPLVIDRRPTGYITEIANLVPSCGKCNQSKRNDSWRAWMISVSAPLSPTARGVADVRERMVRLEAFEKRFVPRHVDFVAIVGSEAWDAYWSHCEEIIAQMAECHRTAKLFGAQVMATLNAPNRP